MKTAKIIPKGENRYDQPHLMLHDNEIPQFEAELAFRLIDRWGVVAAVPDGEDSTGRSKLRLQTPEELVVRAFNTAALAVAEARGRDLFLKCELPGQETNPAAK